MQLKRANITEYIYLVLVFGTYALLKTVNLSTFANEQGVYFYGSWLWTEGIVPYRDFFFSHPPFQLIVSAAIILFTGPVSSVLNLLPALIGAGSGVLLYLIVRREMGVAGGIIATTLFLLSYGNIVISTYYLGQNLALALTLLGVFLFLRNRKFWSGFALGLGFCSAVNMLVAFLGLIFLQWRWSKKRMLNLIGGFLVSAGTLHVLFLFLSGKAFWKQVYAYHFAKPESAPQLVDKLGVFSFVSATHSLLILLSLVGIVLFALRRFGRSAEEAPSLSRERLLMLSCTLIVANTLFLLFVSPIFLHYFLPILPFLAILATEFVLQLWKKLQMTLNDKKISLHLVFAIAILVIASWNLVHGMRMYQKELLYNRFDHSQEIAGRITKDLEVDETIYGGFDITPVVAMLSGRRIAANEVDSSVMRYVSGLYTIEDLVKVIDVDNVGAILARRELGIGFYPPFRDYMKRNFTLKETFVGPKSAVAVEYWRRK